MSVQDIKTNALKISLAVILSAFAVEFLIGVYSNSLALVTDSVHAILDSIVTMVLLVATKWSTKPPDREHTYGHGKIETMGSFVAGIIILVISLFFVYESISRFYEPKPEVLPGVLAIIAAVYALGSIFFRILVLKRALKKTDGSSLRVDLYHALMDMGATSVALVGIVFVMIGFYQGDYVAALILGGLLAVLSLKLIHQSGLELTDAVPVSMVKKVQDIVNNTAGVMKTESVQIRRSGSDIFTEITISLSAASSFEEAHKISANVEKNIKKAIANSNVTVHFEPTWKDVPADYMINKIASSVQGVRGIHNVSAFSSDNGIFISLHVMVDRNMSLEDAHGVSDEIEDQIKKSVSNINHITIHLEPYVSIPQSIPVEDITIEEQVKEIIKKYPKVKKIGRVITLHLQDIFKVDIDCSFEKNLTIEEVHDIVSDMESQIKNQIKNAVITIHPEPI
ncbi:Cation diffusion facilitator family transporter [Nitrosotalea sinensis]|uniref:Cation diffusion facilitator family transporter n=1 Tax=Nitrosotalea sinensis TaxID=1499975 RepID=A0A2H1EF99_9ARCH|nr:cation diffusion facilitator family transporter [Candidatus Nitrosotalea sinensis]SHO43458.1 Cation diffusion facilitator family transporter [Candidatus Nitrosotalea sinensis]